MSYSSKKYLTPQQLADRQAAQEREHELKILLILLFKREQVTVQEILGRLYDIGSVNFINSRIHPALLRGVVRPITRFSKPAFLMLGYRWFVGNCPDLIVNWLLGQVRFRPQQPKPKAVNPQAELKRLRSRVRVTTGALVGVSAVLVAVLAGVDPRLMLPQSQEGQPTIQPAIEAGDTQ